MNIVDRSYTLITSGSLGGLGAAFSKKCPFNNGQTHRGFIFQS